jgi:pimeloyl-ACP methyl ester carboxylesterase
MPMRWVYLHGFPGGPEECALFGGAPTGLVAPDRRDDASQLGFDAYCDHLARHIDAAAGSDPLGLIGFSLGARMALEMADRLGPRVAQVVLVSAAAPLEFGDFLPYMAGRPVFRTAQMSGLLLQVLCVGQAGLARFAPDRLVDALFASARGADVQLAQGKDFRTGLKAMIAHSLRNGATGYRREVCAYVKPWGQLVSRIAAPVSIWHGLEDNWSPPAMARALADALPNVRDIHLLPGQSHYSTLAAVLANADFSGTILR